MSLVKPDNMITRSHVPEAERLDTMPRYFGLRCVQAETLIYDALTSLCPDYQGGYWEFFELSNGGFYMAPTDSERYALQCHGNYYTGEVSADAAGIIATLMGVNQLVWNVYHLGHTEEAGRLSERFYALRDYAAEHPEAADIFACID